MTVCVEDLVRRRPATRLQVVLLAVLLLALIVDGLSLQLLSLVSPLLVAQWQIQKADLGAAFSAALLGMSLGAWAGGRLGDRLGPKAALVGSVIWFAAATCGVGMTSSLTALTLLRFASGIGFGAAVPNAVSLASEWLGPSLRAKAISLMSVGPPLGGMVGSVLLGGILSRLGWRGSFLLCGSGSILLALAIAAVVPELPSYLLSRGRRTAVVHLVRRWLGERIDPAELTAESDQPDASVAAAPEAPQRVGWRFLWGTSLAFFCTTYTAYAFATWTPLLISTNGLPQSSGLAAVFWFNAAAVSAAFIAGPLIVRWGSRRLMTLGAVVAGIAVALLAAVLGPAGPVTSLSAPVVINVATALAGGGTGTVIATVYAVIAAGYPPLRRASGLGLGMMFGRGGGIVSTFYGGRLLGAVAHQGNPYFFVMGVAILASLAGIGLVDRHLAPAVSRRPAPLRPSVSGA